MNLAGRFAGLGPSGFGYTSTAEEVTEGLDLSGRTFLVTGCNSGLGLETTRVLALRGAHVVGTARTREKARYALESVGSDGTALECDLSDPASVQRCVEELGCYDRSLDGVVANAGIMGLPTLEQAYGYELHFFTNHIGHFMLVTGLVQKLTPAGRIVMVSSGAHRRAPNVGIDFGNLSGELGYSPLQAYGQSKLANLLFAKALSRRLPSPKQTSNAVHPGVIPTRIARRLGPTARLAFRLTGALAKTVEQGAATQCYVATHPGLDAVSGVYFVDCNVARPTAHGSDESLAERLWARSEEIVRGLQY